MFNYMLYYITYYITGVPSPRPPAGLLRGGHAGGFRQYAPVNTPESLYAGGFIRLLMHGLEEQ